MSEEILNEEICTDTDISTITEQTSPLLEATAEAEVSEVVDNSPTEADETAEPQDTVESLRAELDALRKELSEKKAAFERMSNEVNEFSELFPSVPLTSIPDSVWQSVKGGIPIAAAYALYEKKANLIEADAKRINTKNSSSSTGPIGKEPTSDFFSPAEVRAMSRDEVRKNYSKIMESMKKWS